MHLDLARGHAGVAADFGTHVHLALDQHDGFGADRRGARDDVGLAPARVERKLDESGAVAEVEEDDAAQVATAVDPSAEADAQAGVFAAEFSTEVRAMEGG